MSSRKRYHLVVIGRVQGVGFRYYVRQKANELNLGGWVRNKMDGSVEIEVEGHEDTVQIFIDHVKLGNGYSRVDRIFNSELPGLEAYQSFFVKY
ncbi:acylphosphatase [Mangrovibacterium diazotrophicum]|uniref:Acylphosphatase n=1 Tax=Mangrovibacterium diazotrophicum TaxID=1261403 RepID=A0A419VV25_9BACT|nr:acylphosphatase [Mangrovibacterium diazotrophicum]RKD85983.1 acylphosphatase [Mangrovibacterium diazotrophicum]